MLRTPFRRGMLGAVALGALVRLTYLLTDEREFVGGDGFTYHLEALRLADGLGYTASLFNVGADSAHHPPGWVTVLGGFSWLGGRSLLAHQLFTSAIGLALIVMAGLVGRRFFGPRVGVGAALISAVYPGFWVLEGQVLSEPLGLLLLGALTLAVADLWERQSLGRSVLVGGLVGLVALVRAEQLLLLVVLVVPVLLITREGDLRRRVAWIGAATGAAVAVIAPWTLYNATRFDVPVVLSTNSGGALVTGNCPSTFEGDLLGYYDVNCIYAVAMRNKGLDTAEIDAEARRVAIDNIVDNLERMPVAVAARVGRAAAVFRPSQTVALTTAWMQTDSTPIWAWVGSFWLLAPLAVGGALRARRVGMVQLPLVAPVVVVVLVVAATFGEPRYHTPADLGIVVLAAYGIDAVLERRRRQDE